MSFVARAAIMCGPTTIRILPAWSWPAARIERRVRAAAPWPGAWTEIGQRIVTLVRVRPTTEFPRALEPAEATVRTDGIAVVRAGDSAVELHEGRDEDDVPLGATDLAAIVASVASLANLTDARRM